jgi:hypothetical protein
MQSAASVEEALALSENVPISLTLGYPVLGITPRTISTLGGPAEQVFNAPPSGGFATWTARAGVGRSVSTTEL